MADSEEEQILCLLSYIYIRAWEHLRSFNQWVLFANVLHHVFLLILLKIFCWETEPWRQRPPTAVNGPRAFLEDENDRPQHVGDH